MDVLQQSNGLMEPNPATGGPSEKPSPPKNPQRRFKILPYIVRNRGRVLLAIILLMVLLEIVEHVLLFNLGENVHIIYDSTVYILLIPAGVWLVLKLLKNIETEREQAYADNVLRTAFSQKLGDARTWDELIREIVEYPHRVAAQANITLYVFNPNSLRMEPEAVCTRTGEVTLKPAISPNPDSLPVGSLPQLLLQNGGGTHAGRAANGMANSENSTAANSAVDAFNVRRAATAAPPLPPHRYDLPITRNEQQIAVLKLEYPLGVTPSSPEIHALKSAMPVMALALEGALLQNLAVEQAAASETQRQKIAQNLHDTLAQNISYLRLKLDQLSGENSIREIGAVLQELERMRGTADEAYQQVRDTLDELNPIRAENLVSTLFKQARAISQRAGFNLRTSQSGTPHSLAAATRQQLLYIVREALYNIEKHASASQVHLAFLWLETELIIKITDDGIGFDPLSVPAEGHYGLWIMHQRAQDIGGTLKIGPAVDSSGAPGTEVTVWVPLPASRIAAEKTSADKPPVEKSA